jgi:adenylate kinase family enzyme
MQRVIIVGCSGAGKSTMAGALGRITGLPVVHLDAHYWRPGWTAPSESEWDDQLAELLRGDRWIMDGNFGRTMGVRMAAADTVVFLDFPRRICLTRVLLRALKYRGRARPDLGPDCPEHLPDREFLGFIWTYKRKSRLKAIRVVDDARAAGKTVVVLRHPREVARYLSSFAPAPVGG